MLDPPGDEPEPVPDHEDPRRDGNPLVHIDEDRVATCDERLQRISIEGDDSEILPARAELVTDQGLREKPRLLNHPPLVVPTARSPTLRASISGTAP